MHANTISGAAALAFAMECLGKGTITSKDTGGIDLRFGKAEGML